jgi:diguanylate cyclase (GGDEF)-like protein/PAS domain S-box-containing protein
MRDTGQAPASERLLVTGSPQTRVVDAVLQGRSDVGFVRSGVLESLAEQGKLDLRQIKVLNSQSLPGYPYLTSSLLYPEWPVAAMPHTDRALTNLVAGVLLSLSREKSPVTQHIYGFDVPANYRTTERLLRDLKARPFDTPVRVTFDDVWATFKPHAIAIIIVAMILLASIVVFARLSQALASARDALEIEHQRLKNILWGTHAGTWEWDIDSGDVRFNERWAEIIGYTLEELQPTSIDTWIKHTHPDDLVRSNELLQKIFDRKVPAYECEVRMKHKQGHWVWILDRGKVVAWSNDGKPLKMAGTHTDITEKKNYEKRLERIATTDILTGLYNRFALIDRLQLAIAIQRRHGGYLAIIFLDLDGFKAVNDSYGHDAGDQLLIQIAERFKCAVREEDTVARLGGDEFVVVLNGLKQADNCIPQVKRLLNAASQPVITNGARVSVSASAGITIFPQKKDVNYSALFRQADAAMYEAKKLGKNTYAFADAVSEQLAKTTS